MGNLLRLPKVEVQNTDVKTPRVLDEFDAPTVVRPSGQVRYRTEGFDGSEDVMVVGAEPYETAPKMEIRPSLENNTGFQYFGTGAASKAEVLKLGTRPPSTDPNLMNDTVMSGVFSAFALEEPTLPDAAPYFLRVSESEELMSYPEPVEELSSKSEADEIILDESDLMICEPEDALFYRAASSPDGLTSKFDFTDVQEPVSGTIEGSNGSDYYQSVFARNGKDIVWPGDLIFGTAKEFSPVEQVGPAPSSGGSDPFQSVFAQRWQNAEGSTVLVSEPMREFSPVEEAWFKESEALMSPPDPYFLAEPTQVLPRAQVVPVENVTLAEGVFRKMWQAVVNGLGIRMWWI